MMVMPSGRRNSDPVPVPSASGQGAEHGGERGHENRAEAQQAGFEDGVARALAFVALGSQGEIDDQDAVLLHQADQQDDADHGNDAEVRVREHEGQQRAHARRREGGKNGDGMDVAFVQDAEHEVDGRQGRDNQVGFAAERILIGLRGAGEHGLDGGRQADAAGGIADGFDGIAQRDAGQQVEGYGDRREEALVVDGEGGHGRAVMGDGVQRDLLAVGRTHVDIAQGFGVLPEARRGFHHHVILVQRFIHGGDLALAEEIVQRIVDQLGRDAEARGGVAIVDHLGLKSAILLVAVDIDDERDRFQLLEHLGREGNEVLEVIAAHGELIERSAIPAADAQVLGGLQKERGAGNSGELGAQALHDEIDGDLAFGERLEGDEHASLIQRGRAAATSAATSGKAVDGVHRRVGGHDVDHLQERLVHGLKRGVLVGDDLAGHTPGILLGEEALGHAKEQVHIEADGGEQHQQGHKGMVEHEVECLAVQADDPIEDVFHGLVEAPVGFVLFQQVGAHHRSGRERDYHGDADGDRKGDGEFAEEAADDAAHEQQRNEHGYQRNAHGDDGGADFLSSLEGRTDRVETGFQVAGDIFDDYDGIIHHKAGGDGEGHEGEVVETVAAQIHHAEGAQERYRDRDAGDEGAPQILEKHEDHQNDQADGEQEGPLDIVDGGADSLRLIHGDLHVDGGGNGSVNLGQHVTDAIDGLNDVGPGLAEDDDQDGGLAVGIAGAAQVFDGIDDLADVGEAYGCAGTIGDEEGLVFVGLE